MTNKGTNNRKKASNIPFIPTPISFSKNTLGNEIAV